MEDSSLPRDIETGNFSFFKNGLVLTASSKLNTKSPSITFTVYISTYIKGER